MAFPVLVEGVGRTGQVAEDLGPVLLQQLRYIIMIVFRPAVFAQKDPQFQLPAPEGKGDRLHQVFDGHIGPSSGSSLAMLWKYRLSSNSR